MKDDIPSRTAEGSAAIRAMHFLYGDHPLVFEDPFAIELISPEEAERYRQGGTHPGMGRHVGKQLSRCRYAEDKLEVAIRSGADQYVILGAGLDSFALRRPDLLAKIRVCEVDRPAVLVWKRELLARTGHKVPATHEFVACDFEHETIAEALGRSSFQSDRRAFFSWVGTTSYLSREAVLRTLESIRSVSTPGSEVAFDYRVLDEFLEAEDVSRAQESYQTAALMGEPELSWWNPLTFPKEVEAIGFDLVENLSSQQMGERYFAGRKDGLWPMSNYWYAHLRSLSTGCS